MERRIEKEINNGIMVIYLTESGRHVADVATLSTAGILETAEGWPQLTNAEKDLIINNIHSWLAVWRFNQATD